MKVRGAVFEGGKKDMSVEELNLGDPGPGEVLVRYAATGLCHSDLSVLNGTLPFPGPAILGHEGAGTVEAVGPDVTGLSVGDTVIASFVPACGQCFHCIRGESELCEFTDPNPAKFTRSDGTPLAGVIGGCATFAEAAVLSANSVVKVETDLPLDQLALIGCSVTTGTGAVFNTANVQPGWSVAVVGCGGVGSSVIQGAAIAGASRIIGVDAVPSKLDSARAIGATDSVLGGEGKDPVAEVMELTGGRGVDVAFEVIGNPVTFQQAYGMARRGGTVVGVGIPRLDATFALPITELIMSEKKVVGSLYGSSQVRRDFPRLLNLAESGRLDLGSLVTRTIALDDINKGFRAMENGEVIRSVIRY